MPILLYIVVKNKIQPRILIFFDEGRPREDPDPFLTFFGSLVTEEDTKEMNYKNT